MARIMILGGGFGGLYTARYLERRLPRDQHEIVLVSTENYMLYTPLLPEAAGGALEPRHVVVPLRTALSRTRVVIGEVRDVNPTGRAIELETQDGGHRTLSYDHLVFALGSSTRMPSTVPGLRDRAISFKTLAEAIYLRNRVLQHLELADAAADDEARRALLSFVFVGGGYAGVEAGAELHAMAREALRFYPSLDAGRLRFVVIEAGPGIMRDLGEEFAKRVERRLVGKGIEIRVATTLREVHDDAVALSDGDILPTRTVVWTAGVAAHPLAARLGAVCDERGRVLCESDLRVRGLSGVWALGDSAAVPDAKSGGLPAPPTAQHALRQARVLARNLAAALVGGPTVSFAYGNLGMLAGLGKRDGACRLLGIPVSGLLAWWIVRTYHLIALPTLARKVRVLIDWNIALFFPRDIAQLGSLGQVKHERR